MRLALAAVVLGSTASCASPRARVVPTPIAVAPVPDAPREPAPAPPKPSEKPPPLVCDDEHGISGHAFDDARVVLRVGPPPYAIVDPIQKVQLRSVPVSGGATTTLVDDLPVSAAIEMAVDGALFYANDDTDRTKDKAKPRSSIWTVDTGAPKKLATVAGVVQAMAVDARDVWIAVGDDPILPGWDQRPLVDGAVLAIARKGGAPRIVAKRSSEIVHDLALDGDDVFFSADDLGPNVVHGGLWRVAKKGGVAKQLSEGRVFGFTLHADSLYFIVKSSGKNGKAGTWLRKVPKNGGDAVDTNDVLPQPRFVLDGSCIRRTTS